MVAIKPPRKVDRLWVLPGGLAATIHADRSGVTLTGPLVNYGKLVISRAKCAELFREWRKVADKPFLKTRDTFRQFR